VAQEATNKASLTSGSLGGVLRRYTMTVESPEQLGGLEIA
jgi:hypothetical protein